MSDLIDVSYQPWVSFCLATYRRPEFLAKTLQSIRQQTMPDFEVIVSDNDPEASGRRVVEEIQDSRFRYFCNTENLGMIKNFNKALERASGEFVVLITDDDPPYPELLATLRSLAEAHPNYGVYYGACDVNVINSDLAKLYNVRPGKNSCLANLPVNTVREFSADEFPTAYLSNQVFPYVLWSTGAVRREIALEIGGVPDYGSPYQADYAYICLAGAYSGCAAINVSLGYQTVHDGNFGRKECKELKIALEGCYEYLAKKMSHRRDWEQIRPVMENFLGTWIVNHSLFLRKYFKFYGYKNQNKELNAVLWQIFHLPYMRTLRWQYLQKAYIPERVAYLPSRVKHYATRLKFHGKNLLKKASFN